MIDDLLTWLLAAVQDMDPVVRTALAGVAIMLETSVLLGLVVPGDSIVLIASTGVQGPIEWLAMVLVVIAGSLTGESIGFAIGHWFGPRIRDSWLGHRLGRDRMESAQHFIARRGGVAVFLSRFLPVLHSLVPLVAGMGAMRYRVFLAWTLPACILWSCAYVSVAAGAAAGYREIAGRLHGAAYLFVGVLVVFLLIVWGVKRLVGRGVQGDLQTDERAEP